MEHPEGTTTARIINLAKTFHAIANHAAVKDWDPNALNEWAKVAIQCFGGERGFVGISRCRDQIISGSNTNFGVLAFAIPVDEVLKFFPVSVAIDETKLV